MLEMHTISVALSIAYLGCIYTTEIYDYWKVIFFIFVWVINTFFFWKWSCNFLILNFLVHHKILEMKIPNIFHKIMAFLLTLKEISKKRGSLLRFRKYYTRNKQNFEENYKKSKNVKNTLKYCEHMLENPKIKLPFDKPLKPVIEIFRV